MAGPRALRLPVYGQAVRPADEHEAMSAARASRPGIGNGPLADPFARRITYLRVSLTDRCNYRCTYCMPEEGVALRPREDVLTFEEIVRLVGTFARLGVRSVRLTGGEPTVRRGLVDLVAAVAAVPGIEDVAMSTNGHLLAELAAPLRAAGLRRLNVSLDSLDADRFRRITRRGDLGRVLAGLEAARAAGYVSIKTNAVALAGFNDDELGALCRYAWAHGFVPRFIEEMPMGDGLFDRRALLSAAAVRARIAVELGDDLLPDAPGAVAGTGPARYFHLASAPACRVGMISAMTEHFCDACNRVRLSTTGELHACLARDDATDLRAPLRAGDDLGVERAIRAAVGAKERGHEFRVDGSGGPRKHMVSIGG